MAGSRFEYVKDFEQDNRILRNCWFVVRIDGRGFKQFCSRHEFEKPNDDRSIRLMNRCAEEIMNAFGDVTIAYGQSDEYSFVFKRDANIWNRRETKLVTNLVSLFTSCFIYYWNDYFPTRPRPSYPPSFDGRIVCYPTNRNLKDYLAWRQADCHINNQYNICFWSLVKSGKFSEAEAYELLKGTRTADKNEMLFTQFGINYNALPALHRKGTAIIRIPKKRCVKTVIVETEDNKDEVDTIIDDENTGTVSAQAEKEKLETHNDYPDLTMTTTSMLTLNVDIIDEKFWKHFWFLLEDED